MIKALGASLVATADAFNPSIFTQLWLVEEVGLDKSAFLPPSVTATELAHHRLRDMELLVVPPRLQVTFSPEDDDVARKALDLLRKSAKALPHTPFRALGMNFDYALHMPEGGAFDAFDRRVFSAPGTPLFERFAAPNARYGGYYSMDVEDARLKLNVRPVAQAKEIETEEALHFNFNYHMASLGDAVSDRADSIARACERWFDHRATALDVLGDVETHGSG